MTDVAICIFLYVNKNSRYNMNEINNLLKTLYKYSFTKDNKPQLILLTNIDTIVSQDDSLIVIIDEKAYNINPIDLRKYKLDIFKIRQFKRIVYVDTDVLFCKDVSALWDLNQFNEADIYGRLESKEFSIYPAPDGGINSGVLILNEGVLNDNIFNGLLNMAHTNPTLIGDEEIINAYLQEHPEIKVGYLPLAYNTYVWNIDKQIPANEVKGVHFVGTIKPWQITEIDLTARHVYYNIIQKVEK
jgi:lipopolysaccharide biosynthesis glycosyltransferase